MFCSVPDVVLSRIDQGYCIYLMVPWKSTGSCGMTAMADRKSASPSLLMLMSSLNKKKKTLDNQERILNLQTFCFYKI
jgi:hypothetical protein